VTLLHLTPYAVPDAFTAVLLVATVLVMLLWSVTPLPLMAAGGLIGIVTRLRAFQRLRDLA